MVRTLGLVAALLASVDLSALAIPTVISKHVLHEKRTTTSQRGKWQKGDRVHPQAIVPVRVALKQNGIDIGHDRLMAVSDPASQTYGQHLSPEEVNSLFAPSDDTVSAVREWLTTSGIDSSMIAHSDNKGWLAADILAEDAERLFNAQFHEYEDTQSGKLKIGCDEYHIPSHLRPHIDYVTPGVKLSSMLKKRSTSSVKRHMPWGGPSGPDRPSSPHLRPAPTQPWYPPPAAYSLPAEVQACGVNITPPCLRALYGIPPGHINDSVNTLGVFEQGDYYSGQDLDSFFANFAPWVPQGTRPTLDSIDGGTSDVAPTNPGNGGESDVDFDIILSLTYPQSVTLYQVDDSVYAPAEVALDNTFNTFLDALDGSYCNYSAYGITGDSPGIDPTYPDNSTGGYKGQRQCGVFKPTRVITASYGESEADFPKPYVERQCNEFMKLGLQGHSIFFSSSDFGVGNSPGDPTASGCLSGNGQNQTIFNPDYPVGCPYVTAVGATMLYANQTVLDPESAMQVDLWRPGRPNAYHYFSSAGGFSNYFTPPSYQQPTLDSYFAKHDPGYPTYSANANATNIGANGGIYNRAGRASLTDSTLVRIGEHSER